MEEKCYTVYMHICPNNKKYIGITGQKPEKRWRNGFNYRNSILFNRAIKKYGWNNIKHEILFNNLTKKEAEQKEIELIAFYKSNQREYGYNVESGGNCTGMLSNKQKEKISKSLKEYYKNNPEARKNISEKAKKRISPTKGKHLSEETKNKISISHLKSEKKNKYKKSIICIETNIKYNSIKEAGRILQIDSRSIQKVCKGERQTAGKLHWKFAKEE